MKKLLMCLMLLGSVLAFAPSAFSQSEQHHKGGHPGGGGQHEPDYAKLKTELTLTDDQVTSWKALDTQYKAKFDELQKSTATEEEKRTKMKELRTAKEADLKKILSTDQYTTYTSKHQQPKGGGGHSK